MDPSTFVGQHREDLKNAKTMFPIGKRSETVIKVSEGSLEYHSVSASVIRWMKAPETTHL